MECKKTNAELAERQTKAVSPCWASGIHFNQNSCYVDAAKGAFLYDVEGREYIDFIGGIGVLNVGTVSRKLLPRSKIRLKN